MVLHFASLQDGVGFQQTTAVFVVLRWTTMNRRGSCVGLCAIEAPNPITQRLNAVVMAWCDARGGFGVQVPSYETIAWRPLHNASICFIFKYASSHSCSIFLALPHIGPLR